MALRFRSSLLVVGVGVGVVIAFTDSQRTESNTLAAELQHCDSEPDADACRIGLTARGPACFDIHHRQGGKYREASFDAAAFRTCIRAP